jgi:bifunctional DNA-binding transcriptional regulator/antitoxin component of YhaV-PrlF toxin-antitoxin module
VRGKIPAPVVRALKAGGGDVLAFERGPGGGVVVRKAAKAAAKKAAKKGGKK